MYSCICYLLWMLSLFYLQSFLYLAWYTTMSILGHYNNFFFAAHLLDIAMGFKTLRTILSSVTHNGKQVSFSESSCISHKSEDNNKSSTCHRLLFDCNVSKISTKIKKRWRFYTGAWPGFSSSNMYRLWLTESHNMFILLMAERVLPGFRQLN